MTTTNTTHQPLSLSQRRAARTLAGAKPCRPVVVVPGTASPTVLGDVYHYETRGGRRIYHPGAYSRRGWSSMVYVHSTIRVEVGAEWLETAELVGLS